MKTLSLFSLSFVALYCFTLANAATFNIRNNCPFTVWAAAVPNGGKGGKKLDSGEVWDLEVNARGQRWHQGGSYLGSNQLPIR